MNKLYFILSVAGWVWLLLVAISLPILLALKRRRAAAAARRGFDVVEAHGAAAVASRTTSAGARKTGQ